MKKGNQTKKSCKMQTVHATDVALTVHPTLYPVQESIALF